MKSPSREMAAQSPHRPLDCHRHAGVCAAKLISLLQTLIIAQVFGVGAELDAYVAANRIPELIVILISGGALTHAFIPIFSGLLAKHQHEAAWRLSSHIINTIFTLALLISAAVFVLGAVADAESGCARI